ncbi:glycosyltransferase family 4 protein [Haliea sp. E17]|uniref:glycosyltransferase family 4 protein n=1 Tax=Haliea sp. E17 TaxID=3401576 RepID=UPI003AAB4725
MMQAITIVTLSTNETAGIRSVIENYLVSGLYDSYEHHWIKTHDNVSAIEKIRIFIVSIFQLLGVIRKKPILHIHTSSRGSFLRKAILARIGSLFGSKTILHLHGSEFKEFYEGSNKLAKKAIRYTFDHADCVIVLSESWKVFVSSISINPNIEVVNNFVKEVQCSRRVGAEDGVNLLFMGRLGKRKGVYDLIDAMELVSREVDNCKVYLCGDGELEEVKARIGEKGLQEVCLVEGWVGPEAKPGYFSLADVFVLLSYNEGLPMSILEAMSSGVAILTTPVGGIPEVIRPNQNGMLVEAGNVAEISRSIIELSRDRENRTRLGRAARSDYLQSYCPDAILPKLHNIYTRLNKGG